MIHSDKPTVKLMMVTRHMAQQWLAKNIERNRKPANAVVQQYANDMDANNWLVTGDTIKFDTDGHLFDGQQRLMALLRSGQKSVPMMVATGIEPSAVRVTDSGRKRTFDQLLTMEGVSRTTAVSAIVRRVMMWERGNPLGQTGRGVNNYTVPTHTELMARYNKTPAEFDTAGARGRDISNAKLGASAQSGFAFWLFAGLDHQMAHAFFDMVVSGANIPDKHPALTLRNRLLRREDPAIAQSALWIRAWNAYREDRELTSIPVTRKGDLTAANFPRPR